MIFRKSSSYIPIAVVLSATLLGACSSSSDDTSDTDAQLLNDGGTAIEDTDTDSDVSDSAGSGSDTDIESTDGIQDLVIDATAGGFGASADDAANKWTYFDFDSGQVVDLTDEQANHSTDWHIAFKRVGVRVNGGASGPGTVRAALIDAQTEFYDEQGEADVAVFRSATAETELAALEIGVDISALSFALDSEIASISGDGQDEEASWWLYNFSDHSINANPDVWSVVRGSTGDSFAKIHATDIQQIERQITIEMFIQSNGEETFSESSVVWTAAIGESGGALCFDFDEMLEVDCVAQAEAWDLQADVSVDGRSWNLWTNSGGVRGNGEQGAAFGPLSTESQAGFVTAESIPTWFEDVTGGTFESNNWYEYNLEGNHRIWPNYRVYGIDTSETIYKMQIVGYYDETGVSAYISLRFDAID